MLSYKTARDICFCYQQIIEGEKLLKKCNEHIEKNGSLAFKDGDRIAHLQLGIPTSLSGRSILQVDDELAMNMITKHIQDRKKKLEILNEISKSESGTMESEIDRYREIVINE